MCTTVLRPSTTLSISSHHFTHCISKCRELSAQEMLTRRRAKVVPRIIAQFYQAKETGVDVSSICPHCSTQQDFTASESAGTLYRRVPIMHAVLPKCGEVCSGEDKPDRIFNCLLHCLNPPLSATSACLRLQSVPALDFFGLPAQLWRYHCTCDVHL